MLWSDAPGRTRRTDFDAPANRRGVSTISAVVTLSALMVAMTGCTSTDDIKLRIHGGNLEFAYCDPFHAESMIVSVSPLALEGTDYTEVWKASGNLELEAGQVVTVGKTPQGMSAELDSPFDPPSNRIAVDIERYDSSGALEDAAQGIFDGSKLSEDHWIDQSGWAHSTAC